MQLSDESKQEIYRRLNTFMSSNDEWIPTTYIILVPLINKPIVKGIVKSASFNDPSSYSALLLYILDIFSYDDLMKVYQQQHGGLNSKVKSFFKSDEIKNIKQEPNTINYLKQFLSAVFEDVGPINAESPFERPDGVKNIYFQDLTPLNNYVINRFYDPKRKFTKDYFVELAQREQSEIAFMNKMLDHINALYNDPIGLYKLYTENPTVKAIIDYSAPQTKKTFLDRIELGRELNFKTTIQPGMMTGSKADYEFIDRMRSGLNEDLIFDSLTTDDPIVNKFTNKSQHQNNLLDESNKNDAIMKCLKHNTPVDECPVDGPTPNELLKYCKDLVTKTEQNYEDTTTPSLTR